MDLTAAFDHVNRTWLFDSIKLRFREGESPKVFDLLEKLYQNTTLTHEESNSSFITSSGVRQGGPESPVLFNLFIDFVMRVFEEKCAQNSGIKFFEHKYQINGRSITREERISLRHSNLSLRGTSILPWCGYADDLILFLEDKPGLQHATSLLNQVFRSFGLSINVSKTETMILNHKFLQEPGEYPDSIIHLMDTPLKNVKTFKYLGSYLHYDEPSTGETELNHRIQLANAKFAEMMNLLQNHRINLRTRITFLDSYVRSRLTHSCQNWTLTSAQYDRLDVVYRRFLRRMVRGGFSRRDDDDDQENQFKYKMTNNKIHSICNTVDLSVFIKAQQKSYACHLIRTPIERSIKKLLFNNDHYVKVGRSVPSLLDQVVSNNNTTVEQLCNDAMRRKGGNRREPNLV